MKNIVKMLFMMLLPTLLVGQNIQWQDVSSEHEFPQGLRLFHGTISGNNNFFAYYYEVDMTVPEIAIRPYLSATSKQVHNFAADVGAYGAVNGGFFAGTSSVSSVVFPGEVPARNLISLSRTVGGVTRTYPVIRPLFAVNIDRSLATEWVYHHTYSFDDIYVYDEPMDYICSDPNPLPVPVKADGYQYEDIAYGLGGGPMLVKDGVNVFTYCEEIWWGSGVDLNVNRPRTVVGYTADQKVIMLVTNSMKVEDLPQLMLDLNCVGAMNLDGGGSTAMAVGGTSLYDQNRPVPTILAVVHSDSLGLPQTPVYEKFMDTGDEGVTSNGSWFATANPGFWESPSMLHELASHDQFYQFPLNLPTAGEYEIYGWWTSHPNRAADTPYFITHTGGTTQVAVNQSVGGSMWNLIGTFQFDGTPEENVKITAGATTNQFVVADGLRIVSYDQGLASNQIKNIDDVDDITVPFGTSKENALAMLDAQTTLYDTQGESYLVDLTWQADDYNENVPGDYTATGSFDLPDGVEQTDPPTLLQVEAIITVLEEDDTSIFDITTNGLEIYPNPSSGVVTVKGKTAGEHSLEVLSLNGQSVYQSMVKGVFDKELDLTFLKKGVYLIRITGHAGNTVHKLVIQ